MPMEPLEPLELEAETREDEKHFFRRLGELCFAAAPADGARPASEARWVASAPSRGLLVLADSWGARLCVACC